LLVLGVEAIEIVVSLMEEVDHASPVGCAAGGASRTCLALLQAQLVAASRSLRATWPIRQLVESSALAAVAVRNELLDVALAFTRRPTLASARNVTVRVIGVSVELVTQHRGLPEAAALITSAGLWSGVVESESLVGLLLAAWWSLPLLVLVAQNVGGRPWCDTIQRSRRPRIAA